jgi:hypothetical protein
MMHHLRHNSPKEDIYDVLESLCFEVVIVKQMAAIAVLVEGTTTVK